MASRRDRRMEIMDDFCPTQLMKSKHPGHKGFAIQQGPKIEGGSGWVVLGNGGIRVRTQCKIN